MPLIGPVSSSATETGSFGRILARTDIDTLENSLWGSGSATTVSQSMDASGSDGFAYVSSSATTTTKHNAIYRSYGGINIGHAITVTRQNGQARGLTATFGGTGVELGAILSTIGSPGIPSPIRPGSGTGTLQGGVVQFIGKGIVNVGADITAAGTNASSEGGGGGGLVVVISDTLISGAGNIGVSGSDGHSTGAAKGGGGGYSGEPGGHAGIGGGGGGGQTFIVDNSNRQAIRRDTNNFYASGNTRPTENTLVTANRQNHNI